MIAFANVPSSMPSIEHLHSRFLTIVPRIQNHGRVYFRGLKCSDRKRDCISEMVALAWHWFVRLYRCGKDPTRFPSALATFAAKQVNIGRRLCGQEASKDVLSPYAQRRHGFTVTPIPHGNASLSPTLQEALTDNTHTPVPEQAAFRHDWPLWRQCHSERAQRMLDDLMQGERTLDVARKYGLSPARVSQLRRQFQEDWELFCEDPGYAGTAA